MTWALLKHFAFEHRRLNTKFHEIDFSQVSKFDEFQSNIINIPYLLSYEVEFMFIYT